MAIGVRDSSGKRSARALQRKLQSVIAGGRDVLQRENSSQTGIGTTGEGIDIGDELVCAGRLKIDIGRIIGSHKGSALELKSRRAIPRMTGYSCGRRRAIAQREWLVGSEGIVA